jgi:hypothetical protein
MKGELKELLFAQLQALSRAYQSAVSIMSTYEREFERLEKELADERGARDADRAERDERIASLTKLGEERDAELVREREERERAETLAKERIAALTKERNELAGSVAKYTEDAEDDDPLSVV